MTHDAALQEREGGPPRTRTKAHLRASLAAPGGRGARPSRDDRLRAGRGPVRHHCIGTVWKTPAIQRTTIRPIAEPVPPRTVNVTFR